MTVSVEGYALVLSTSSEIKNPDRILVNGEESKIPSDFIINKIIYIEKKEN